MSALLDALGTDRDALIILLVILVVLLFAITIIMFVTTRKMFRRYDYFMRGKDAESLEDIIIDSSSKLRSMQDQAMDSRDRLKKLQYGVSTAYNKTGIVKYNAFEGMGGKSSFALVLLDQSNTGILLNAMHSRTSCYIYIKEIKEGVPETGLSNEEQEALDKAMNR